MHIALKKLNIATLMIIFDGMSYLASNLSYSIDPVCRVQKKIIFFRKRYRNRDKIFSLLDLGNAFVCKVCLHL